MFSRMEPVTRDWEDVACEQTALKPLTFSPVLNFFYCCRGLTASLRQLLLTLLRCVNLEWLITVLRMC